MSSTTRRIRRIALVAALVSVALVPAIAQNGTAAGEPAFDQQPRGRGQFGWPRDGGLALERLDRELGFTDAQKTQIGALLMQQRTALKSAVDSLRQAQQALDSAVMQTPQDDGLLQTQVTAVSSVQAQIALARAQTEARIYQLLTADQKEQAQQWLTQLQQRLQQRGRQPGQ